jgi:peroxiredoxin
MKKINLPGHLISRGSLLLLCPLAAGVLTLAGPNTCRAHSESHPTPSAARPSPSSPSPTSGPLAPTSPAQALLMQSAPAFALADVQGKTHALADYHSQSIALYVFCGCEPCHQCALAWGEIQRSGALAKTTLVKSQTSKPQNAANGWGQVPLTLVLFHGDTEKTRTFAEETQLDLKHTVLLPDADEKVSQSYQALLCPRVFVIDAQGILRYTNIEKGADSYQIPAPLIVARAVDALRRASDTPPASNTRKPTDQTPSKTVPGATVTTQPHQGSTARRKSPEHK